MCIVELNLKDNLLSELPDTICKMKWLSILDVSHNKIMLFPKNWDNIRLDHNIGKCLTHTQLPLSVMQNAKRFSKEHCEVSAGTSLC